MKHWILIALFIISVVELIIAMQNNLLISVALFGITSGLFLALLIFQHNPKQPK